MRVKSVATVPIEGQMPGTSGLRKKTAAFIEPGYLENFVQSVFDAVGGLRGKTLTVGGLILSASHNPAGEHGDFGIKYNIPSGGPAPESITDAIYRRSQVITQYQILDACDMDLSTTGERTLGGMRVEVINPVAIHAGIMWSLFDFEAGSEELGLDPQQALAPVIAAASDIAEMRTLLGRSAPDVRT